MRRRKDGSMKIRVQVSAVDAIRSGRADAGSQDIDVSNADLATLTADEREILSQMVSSGDGCGIRLPEASFAALAGAVRAALAAIAVKVKAELAAAIQRDADYRAALDAYASAETDNYPPLTPWVYGGLRATGIPDHPAHAMHAEAEAAKKAEETAKVEAEVAKDAAKQQYIADWVSANGTDSEISRHRAGMLCRQEILVRIADQAFGVVGIPDFVAVSCNDNSCPCGHSRTVTCLPASAFSAYQRLLVDRGVTVEDLESVIPCPPKDAYCDTVTPERVYQAVAHVVSGPFIFDRRVNLG